jgi:glucokinase-like ROK family protein
MAEMVRGAQLSRVENTLQAAIVRALFAVDGAVSRAHLASTLGVGRSAVNTEIRRLVALGLVEEAGFGESRGGRRSHLLQIPRRAGFVAAVDLGATSVDVALTSLASDVLAHAAVDAEIGDGPEATLERVGELVDRLVDEQGLDRDDLRAAGVGVPGPVEHVTGRVVAPPIMPGWNDFPVRDAVSERLGCPVFVDNDVNVMALGEHARGAGRSVEHLAFVKVGTGIGVGVIVNGQLVRGADGCAGDLGHVCIDPDGLVCTCGNRGCLEAHAGGAAIARAGEESARSGSAPLLAATLEQKGALDAADVGFAASHGDLEALSILRDRARLIGLTLATLVSLLNPSLIVIGGGVARTGDAFLAEIRTAIYRRTLPLATRNLPIVTSELGADAGVVGASVLAARGFVLGGVA